jgi:hypothetical protein
VEVGELVAVELPGVEKDDECPFSHEKPNPTEKNELGGVGSKLAENLIGGIGINTSSPPTGTDYKTGTAVNDPRKRTVNPIKAVEITVDGEKVRIGKRALLYPLTCAAHHLLPAQESLKGHPILKFMCKDGEKQDFMKSGKAAPATVKDSKVWGNVAYNVNGCQNGVWLPGNYAVGGGVGGVQLWMTKVVGKREAAANKLWVEKLDLAADNWEPSQDDPQENEKPTNLATLLAKAPYKNYALAGTNYHINDKNPKWAYVRAAMNAASGQFHDRHGDYSKVVKSYLDKVEKSYREMFKDSAKATGGCKKCRDATRPAKAKEGLLGPPYGIVGRLQTCSSFFKGYVGTSMLISKVVFTSKWVQAFMQTNPKKRFKLGA